MEVAGLGQRFLTILNKRETTSEAPWGFFKPHPWHLQLHNPNVSLSLCPEREVYFCSWESLAKTVAVDEGMLCLWTSRWKLKRKKKKSWQPLLPRATYHILQDVGLGHAVPSFTSLFSVPATFREKKNGGGERGREQIRVSNGNLKLFVFVARGLIKHSGSKFNYALKSDFKDRPHSNIKCFPTLFFFSFCHKASNILHAAEQSTQSQDTIFVQLSRAVPSSSVAANNMWPLSIGTMVSLNWEVLAV